MVSLKQVIALTLFGTAIAGPLAHRNNGGDWDGPFTGRLPGTKGNTGSSEKPHYIVVTTTNTGSSSGTYNAPAVSSSPAATTVTTGSTGSTGSTGGSGYMAVVNKWRAAGGYKALTQSSKLEANALKTATDGHGSMVHELNPGTMGQVLAPGDASNFESVYVGGWLCENHSLPGLNGICGSMEKGWDHSNGETGHADILTSPSYSQIGCALADKIWACDLA